MTVEVENTLQEYQVKVEDAKVDPASRATGQAGSDGARTN
jgi:hypothetical protein